VLQNAKYDQHVFANHGIALAGIAHDTMLQSYVIESDKGHDLGQLAAATSASPPSPTKTCAARAPSRSPSTRSISSAPQYAAEDADVTLRVHNVLHPRLPTSRACRASTTTSRCPPGR
jgi:DNA polymerase-1